MANNGIVRCFHRNLKRINECYHKTLLSGKAFDDFRSDKEGHKVITEGSDMDYNEYDNKYMDKKLTMSGQLTKKKGNWIPQ